MNGIGGWFRQFTLKMTAALRSFMTGRYGTDRLNMVILCAGLVASILSSIIRVQPVNLVLLVLSYALIGQSGPDHDKRFTVAVSLNGEEIGQGTGSSKKRAEQEAARAAIENLAANE